MKQGHQLNALLWLAGATATVSLVLEYGFGLDERGSAVVHLLDFLVVTIFVLEALVRLLVVDRPLLHIRRHGTRYLLVFWLILELPLWANYGFRAGVAGGAAALLAGKIYLAVAQVYLLLETLVALGRLHGRLAQLRVAPLMIGPTPFLLIIVLGTALLALPRCRTGDWSLIDLLFTATSAVCVTGLATRDIAGGLTPFGHGVLMVLIQVGGLGVMTVSAFLATLHGDLRGRGDALLLSHLLGAQNLARARRLLVQIVAVTVTFELVGAFVLHGTAGGWDWFTAAFHSVSAFCNAGFSTLPAGLESYPGRTDVLAPVAALIIAGGLGFPVLLALPGSLLGLTFGGAVGLRSEQKRVLGTTLVLLLAGWGAFLLLPLPGNALDRFFQSVTTRTAGFSSFTQLALGGPALAVTILLMVIGAAPLSTGGGIKVTTLTLLFEWPWRRRARRDNPSRHLAVDMALAMTGLYLAAAAGGTSLLILLERLPWREALFLTVSALSTVGLDRGVAPALSVGGKVIVIVLMIGGRVALLSVLLTLITPWLRRRCGGEVPDVAVG